MDLVLVLAGAAAGVSAVAVGASAVAVGASAVVSVVEASLIEERCSNNNFALSSNRRNRKKVDNQSRRFQADKPAVVA